MPFVKPKGYVTGFNVRNGDFWDNNSALCALCESVCLDFNLSDLFPNAPVSGVLTENATERDRILAQIQRARTQPNVMGKPYNVELRPRSGFWDPDWLKAQVGRLDWATDNGWNAGMAPYKGAAVPGAPGAYYFIGGTTKWWDPAATPLRALMTAKMLSLFASTSATDNVVALTVAWTSTQFTEVANKQFGIQQNVDTALANGYTLDAEQAMLVASWQDALPRAQQYGLSIGTSWNTYGTIDTTKSPAKFKPASAEDYTFGLIDSMVSTLGVFGQPQNHSFDQTYLGGDRSSSAERRLWDKLASVKSQISEQTATLTKMNADGLTVKGAVEAIPAMGSLRIELPQGCEKSSAGDGNYLDVPYAQTWSPKIGYRPERDAAPASSGGGGSSASGSWVSDWLTSVIVGDSALSLTLPATIPDGSILWLFPAAGANVNIGSVTGGSGSPMALVAPADTSGAAAADDTNGSNLHSIAWKIPVSSADAGHAISVALTGTGGARGTMIGRISLGWDSVSAARTLITTDNGTATGVTPATTNQGPTFLVSIARVSSGSTAITQPGTAVSSVIADTAATTGYNVIAKAVELAPGQTGAGTVSTSPAALKVTTYAVALMAPAVVDPGTGGGTGGGTGDPGPGGTGTQPPVGGGGTSPSPIPSLPTTTPLPLRWLGVRYDGRIVASLPSLVPDGALRRTLGQVQTATFKFYLDGSRGPVDPEWSTATLEGASCLIAYTGDPGFERIVWGGVVTKRSQSLDGVVQLAASTLEAYLDRRFTGDLALSGTSARVIANIVRKATLGDSRVAGSRGWPFVATNVTGGTGTTSGSWTWKDSDDKSLLDAINEVAPGSDTTPGAQWGIGWTWQHKADADGADLILPVVTTGSPRVGNAAVNGVAPVGFTARVMSDATYSSDWSDGNGATIVTAASTAGTIRVVGYSATSISGSPARPVWESRVSGPDSATTASALAAFAKVLLADIGDGRQSVAVTLQRASAPQVGVDWDLGDDVQVTLDGLGGQVSVIGQVVGYDLDADTVTPYIAMDGVS